MIHPATEVRYINRTKGYGLFAIRFIPKGTIIWVKDQLDREIRREELLQYDKMVRETIINYSYRNNKGHYIFCWDNARYMNHDCNPNSCITPYEIEISVRDIHKNEEIVNHYGMLNIVEPFTISDSNNETIYPDDLISHGQKWDAMLEEAFPHLIRVAQPLRPLISDAKWVELEEISKKERQMRSVTSCYFRG